MLRFLCKSKALTPFKNAANSPTQICLVLFQNWQSSYSISISITTCSSSRTSTKQQSSSTVRKLITNSYGLSDQFCIRSKSSQKADSVIKLFESCGISQTHIEAVVSKNPKILLLDAQRILKPKIDFLRSVGLSEAEVANMIGNVPRILFRSLNNQLIPSFDFLTTLLGGEQNAVSVIKRCTYILDYNVSKTLAPNLSTLMNFGVPKSRVSKIIGNVTSANVIGNTKPDWFNKVVCVVRALGFDPWSSSFEHAFIAMAFHTESTWEDKLKFYGNLGFSDKEIRSMFRKQPISMRMSKNKIRGSVKFFVNKFHWSPSQLSARPNVLMYSLGKRIIPRCSVLQVLVSRNRIQTNVAVLSILVRTEKDFVRRYVTKYKDEVPEVLDAYQGKLKFDEYNFDFGRTKGAMDL